jgi:opacity protein-like surface antigen
MKKLLALLALVPLVASAQDFPAKLKPGTFELAGSSNLSVLSSSNDYKSNGQSVSGDQTNWNVQGFGLFYVAPNIGVGGTVSYQSLKLSGDFADATIDTFSIGPAVGFSFPVGPQVDLFGRAAIVYASQEFGAGAGENIKSSGFGFGLQAGVKYFVLKNLSLDGAVVFQYLSLTADSTPSVDITSTGFGANLGISVYFDTK